MGMYMYITYICVCECINTFLYIIVPGAWFAQYLATLNLYIYYFSKKQQRN